MLQVESGYLDGRRWIAGHVPMKQNVIVYIDTRDGQGIPQVLNFIKDFIKFEANQISLPSASYEDVVQELNIIAIQGIADYDVSKKANLLTFLQNHIKNRIINLYKHATEKRRTALHGNMRFCKVRCPQCKNYSVIDEVATKIQYCFSCGHKKQEGEVWKSYPVMIHTVSANDPFTVKDGKDMTIQDLSSHQHTAVMNLMGEKDSEIDILQRLSIYNIVSSLDELTQSIILLHMEGYSIGDIAKRMELTVAEIRQQIVGLASNSGFKELKIR